MMRAAAHVALLELAERHVSITPKMVVDEARDPASPLHAHFTWDDSEAAEKYRLYEARQLIGRYDIVVVGGDESEIRVRQFTSLPDGDGFGYVRTDEALGDSRRSLVIDQAMRDVAALRMKYQALIDFDAVLQASIGKKTRRKAS